ncbi:ADP-ribosylation/Crystallin J1 [Mycena rebaudengoi]|nr:ADP-ribosylation/Crystallin J1 [Mycena rebaudengoi]
MNDSKILDKAEGALIGSALGDAIGIYTEFMTAGQAQEFYGVAPNFSLVAPETPLHNDTHRSSNVAVNLSVFLQRAWTDDTDHTILMVLSYLRMRELSPNDFAVRLRSWCEQGLRVLDRLPMGLGKTVGSVQTEEETFAAAIRMGAVTHADPRCAVSVAIVSALVRAMCRGEIHEEDQLRPVIERAWDYVRGPLDRAEFDRHCLGSALWCLRQVLTRQETFRSAMTTLVMYGGDADTNGAVAGALMGALYGYRYLPKEEWYRGKIAALFSVAGLSDGVYDSASDTDTELDGGKGFITEEEMKKREMGIMEKMLLSEKERREAAEAKAKAAKSTSGWKSWMS